MAGGEDLGGLASAFDSPTFGKDGSFRLDEPVGSASISPCGRDVVLASRQGLHIIDLDSPYSPPRHLPHRTPWEVADVQWSPFASRDYWVVSTSNQKALVWNLAMVSSQASIEHVLHAHTRAITDINFSAHHPDVLATCAVDSFVHCWDLRHPARPAVTFCDWFAGATQVKWNRQESHILASSHDKFLRIWDDRKGAYPLKSIEAHATKIYGVDWNRTATNNLITCSLDRTIKFWDYTNHNGKPDRIIATPFPVWRARYTPFGSGLLAMPQRGDHDLHLYDCGLDEGIGTKSPMPSSSVYQFSGHNDQVKEFLWRFRGTIADDIDNREFQLVSWGTDRILRLHRVVDDVLDSVGYRQGMKIKTKLNFTRRNATYKTFRDSPERSDTKTRRSTSVAGMFDPDGGVNSRNSGVLSFGMTQAAMPTRVGWGNEGFIGSVAGKKAKASGEMDAISWMRGVRIGRRVTTPSGMDQSLASMLSPELKADKSWDAFESLGEEISHVGDKFGRVAFEKIDMQNRTVIVSFSGPWGSENSNIHMKCRVEFPAKYPNAAAPKFDFEHTTLMSDESLTHICAGVRIIAERYLVEQKSSLEASLQYLLGEQDLEESLGWLEQRRESNNLDLVQDPALSSSDEDDELGGTTTLQIQGLDMSDGTIAVSNAQYNVPLPKACGALWADDGRLVCFFPPKEDKKHTLLDSLSLRTSDKSRKTIFEGFGRAHSGSIIPKRLTSTLKTMKDCESSFEESSTSSSGSSSSSEGNGILRHHFLPSMAWRGSSAETQDALSVDDSHKSSGRAGFTASAISKSNNYIAIHDCSNLLPSKRSLAQSYVVGGEGSDCCEVNARVAEESGDSDLASIWLLLQLLLKDEVPLEMMQHPYLNDDPRPIMVIARQIVSPLKSRDSAVDLTFDLAEEKMRMNTKGTIKWGNHPFGRQWLINSFFQHFERLADVQMLAMLSCVLSGHLAAKRFMDVPGRDDQQSQTKRTSSELVGERNDALVGYFPSLEVARNLLRPATATLSDPQKRASGPQSTSSSVGATISDPMTPFSTGATPPKIHRPAATNFERTDSLVSSIPTSSEYQRNAHRSSSNIASTFAASFSRPFSFSASVSSSPPTTYLRKRLSPAGSYIGAPPTGVTWGATSFFSKTSTIANDPKSVYSFSVSDTEEDIAIPKAPVFTTKLKNQNQFGNEGYADTPLLDPAQSWRYHAYRELYAHMLFVWELPLARCEVLKYNDQPYSVSGFTPKLVPRFPSPLIAISKSNVESPTADEETATRLDFITYPTTLASEGSQRHDDQRCAYYTGTKSSLICLLCAEIIRGLSSPCLACGHVLHASCRSIMLSQVITATEDGLCISGCGCRCADHFTVEVEAPLPSQISPSPTVVGNTSVEQDQYISQGEVQNDEDTWEDITREHVAYESLARVRERYITPKPSKIWRGEERRDARLPATRKESYQ